VTTSPRPKFRKIVEAALTCVRNEIAGARYVAFALFDECGPPGKRGVNTGRLKKFKAIAKEMARHPELKGRKEFSEVYLRKLCDTAAWVQHDNLLSSQIPFTVYIEAGNAKTFIAARQKAKRKRAKFDVPFITRFKTDLKKKAADRNRRKHRELHDKKIKPEVRRAIDNFCTAMNDALDVLDQPFRSFQRHLTDVPMHVRAKLIEKYFDPLNAIVTEIGDALEPSDYQRAAE
jgi:hypothetical protein